MTTDTIPQDILDRAVSIALDLGFGLKTVSTTHVKVIARAIHAERLATEARVREECAKIADGWDGEPARTLAANVYGLSDRDIDVAANTARGIAAAIREGR